MISSIAIELKSLNKAQKKIINKPNRIYLKKQALF